LSFPIGVGFVLFLVGRFAPQIGQNIHEFGTVPLICDFETWYQQAGLV